MDEIDDGCAGFFGRFDEVEGLAVAEESPGEKEVVEVGRGCAEGFVVHGGLFD